MTILMVSCTHTRGQYAEADLPSRERRSWNRPCGCDPTGFSCSPSDGGSGEGEWRQDKARGVKGRSNMSMAIDRLKKSKTPLHVSEIIRQAHERYGTTLDRESLVGTLVKKRKAGVVTRTAANKCTVWRSGDGTGNGRRSPAVRRHGTSPGIRGYRQEEYSQKYRTGHPGASDPHYTLPRGILKDYLYLIDTGTLKGKNIIIVRCAGPDHLTTHASLHYTSLPYRILDASFRLTASFG